MTGFTAAMDNFLADDTPGYAKEREFGRATHQLSVFRTQNYKLVRVCSLSELRVAVALASMAMAAFALEKTQAASVGVGMTADPTIVLALPSGGDLCDLLTLQHAVGQGDSPRLIEGALDVWHAGQPSSHRYGGQYRHLWPKGTTKLAGYQGGVEGLVRLNAACWTVGRPWLDTNEHGVASVLPRAKAAFKHLRDQGIPVSHDKRVLEILGALAITPLLQFLNEPELTC